MLATLVPYYVAIELRSFIATTDDAVLRRYLNAEDTVWSVRKEKVRRPVALAIGEETSARCLEQMCFSTLGFWNDDVIVYDLKKGHTEEIELAYDGVMLRRGKKWRLAQGNEWSYWFQ